MAAKRAWLLGNTMMLELGSATEPLTDGTDGSPITTATVEATVVNESGVPLAGESWPVSMPHVAGGVYRGFASYLVALASGALAIARITATFGGVVYYAEVPVKGTIRTGATAET